MNMMILQQECDPTIAKDKKLPRDSYLISYFKDDELKYDIARGNKIELFDYYYDTYKNVNNIIWTDGTINPKLYDYVPKTSKRKK